MASLLEGTSFQDEIPEGGRSFGSDGRPCIIAMSAPIPFSESVIADRDVGNQSYRGILGYDPGADFGMISAISFSGSINRDEAGLDGDTAAGLSSGGQAITIETYAAPADTSVVSFVALKAFDGTS